MSLDSKTHYALLGVSPAADQSELDAARSSRLAEYALMSDRLAKDNYEQRLEKAYEVLSDPLRRRIYDATLLNQTPVAPTHLAAGSDRAAAPPPDRSLNWLQNPAIRRTAIILTVTLSTLPFTLPMLVNWFHGYRSLHTFADQSAYSEYGVPPSAVPEMTRINREQRDVNRKLMDFRQQQSRAERALSDLDYKLKSGAISSEVATLNSIDHQRDLDEANTQIESLMERQAQLNKAETALLDRYARPPSAQERAIEEKVRRQEEGY